MEARRVVEEIAGEGHAGERRVIAIGKRVRHHWLVEMSLAERRTLRAPRDRRNAVRAA